MSDDRDDTPEAVAKGLGELAHIAGARVAVLEHLDRKVKEALEELRKALDELRKARVGLATRNELEAKVTDLERRLTGRARWRMLVVGVLLALLAGGIVVNRESLSETQRNVNRHIDYAAICASKTPGDDTAIEACIAAHVGR